MIAPMTCEEIFNNFGKSARVVLYSDAEAVERERDELKAEIADMKKHTWCAYCGHEILIDDDLATKISEHIMTCEKHPLHIALAALSAAQGEVERLRETLDDIAHVGNYEASQRAIDALKEAKGECHHLTAYYNEEADNYYCSECHRGMGIAYYNVAQALLKTERQKQEIQKSPQTP